jgi:hypothetical protein
MFGIQTIPEVDWPILMPPRTVLSICIDLVEDTGMLSPVEDDGYCTPVTASMGPVTLVLA